MSSIATTKRAKPPPLPTTSTTTLRLLCHVSFIGAFIGKSGSSIKQLQLETGSKIRVDDSSGSNTRIIIITAPNFPFKKIQLRKNDGLSFEVEVSVFQETAVRVFEKVLEVSNGEGVVVCRVLVEEREAGAVIGKGGKIVQKLKKESGAKIRVLLGHDLPFGVSCHDEIVEIEGDEFAVKKALLGVCGQLQEYSAVEKSSIKDSQPLESTSQPAVHNFHVDPLHQASMQSAGHEFRVDLPLHCTPLHPAVNDFHIDPLRWAAHQPDIHDFRVDPLRHRTPLPVATTSSTSPIMGRPMVFEAEKFLISDSKPQLEDVVFRILCSNERIGGVIGRGGTIIKALQDESGAKINVGSPVANCDERLITISSKELVETKYSAAQRAAVLVFCKSVGAATEKGLEPGLHRGSTVSARLLVPKNQVGCLLGKGGTIISEMRKVTGVGIHIINGDQVPKCASPDDEVVEISGKFVNAQDALYLVTSKLRNNLFTSKDMASGTGNSNFISDTSVYGKEGNITPIDFHQSSDTSRCIDGQATSRHGLDHFWRPSAVHFQLSETAGVDARNFVTPGRGLASATAGAEHARAQRSSVETNTKVEVLVPESAISSVYGNNGSNLSRIRQISGAEVNVHEAVPGTSKRIVVISGTPEQTRAAQSVLHAFIQ